MKKIIYIFCIAIASQVFVQCNDKLDLTDPSALGIENFIFDEDTARAALLDGYNDMQSGFVTGSYPRMFQGLYADELAHPGSFPTLDEALVNNLQTNNVNNLSIFSNHYDIINTATEVIRSLELLDDVAIDPTVKAELTAEAHALRAYGYFQLVKVYGGLPITELTVPLDGPDANNAARNTEAEVYAYILNEISLAEGNISNANPITQFTNNSVQVMKADVLMNTGAYGAAESALAPIIGQYSLTDTYAEVFDTGVLENSVAIMRINFNAADSGDLQTFFTSGGRREVSPSNSLIAAFPAGDDRINQIFEPNNPTTNFINKFRSNSAYFPYVYRYADVLLMYSELLARRDAPNANVFIDQVRTRAGLGSVGTLNSSNFVNIIANERRLEFYGEADRWETVKRLGLAQQVISSKQGVNFVERQLLWPIPQAEFDRNSLMTQADQNPGY